MLNKNSSAIIQSLFLYQMFLISQTGSNVVKQWSVNGKLAFLGVMSDECLKDGNACEEGFTLAMWIKTTPNAHQPRPRLAAGYKRLPLLSGDGDRRGIAGYLVSNGGQSAWSNGFYVRRTVVPTEYEIGVTYKENLWSKFLYLRPNLDVHFVFTWRENKGLKVYIDGLLAGEQLTPTVREYYPHSNNTGDPNPHFVANGDSLLFRQLFNAKTFLPRLDVPDNGHVVNVSYYHEFKNEVQIGEMTAEYDDRLVAGCFFEIPFGAQWVSMLSNYTRQGDPGKTPATHVAYFKCRNDCIMKKSPNKEPWTPWLAIVDPRTFNCFCMLVENHADARHSLDANSCQNSYKQTKAQFSSVALAQPPMSRLINAAVEPASGAFGLITQFDILVPSMKCFFLIMGQFGSYKEADSACKRRGGTLAVLTNKVDLNFVLNELDWKPLVGGDSDSRLIWIESRTPGPNNTCTYCTTAEEDCTFLVNNLTDTCGCQCSKMTNRSTTTINKSVGALCQRVAFDLPAQSSVGRRFCGIPALAPEAKNTFAQAGETLKTFFVIPGKMSWDDAVDACVEANGVARLASIRSFSENKAVQKELNEMWTMRSAYRQSSVMEPVWIGARRSAPHRPNFVWTDSSPVLFTAWSAGEPNNAIDKDMPDGLNGEECVGLWPNWASGVIARGWNDFNCFENRTANFGALCEVY